MSMISFKLAEIRYAKELKYWNQYLHFSAKIGN